MAEESAAGTAGDKEEGSGARVGGRENGGVLLGRGQGSAAFQTVAARGEEKEKAISGQIFMGLSLFFKCMGLSLQSMEAVSITGFITFGDA